MRKSRESTEKTEKFVKKSEKTSENSEKSAKKFICDSLDDTKKAAEYFSKFARVGQCFALYGDLGYGKTTFAQYLIKILNPKIENIISPTFNIIQTYPSEIAEIWHMDCYRLKSADEFFELGAEEAFANCVTIVEWPEIISDFLPTDTIKIRFSKTAKTHEILCKISR